MHRDRCPTGTPRGTPSRPRARRFLEALPRLRRPGGADGAPAVGSAPGRRSRSPCRRGEAARAPRTVPARPGARGRARPGPLRSRPSPTARVHEGRGPTRARTPGDAEVPALLEAPAERLAALLCGHVDQAQRYPSRPRRCLGPDVTPVVIAPRSARGHDPRERRQPGRRRRLEPEMASGGVRGVDHDVQLRRRVRGVRPRLDVSPGTGAGRLPDHDAGRATSPGISASGRPR